MQVDKAGKSDIDDLDPAHLNSHLTIGFDEHFQGKMGSEDLSEPHDYVMLSNNSSCLSCGWPDRTKTAIWRRREMDSHENVKH